MPQRPAQRWIVLGAFALVAGVTQMLWLNFAPLIGLVQQRYGVSELAASALVLVFPLVYVLLSIPAGMLIDARGYRYSVGLGAVVGAAFAGLRIWDTSFTMLLVAQLGISVAQPFVVNGIGKLVADWFDEAEGAIANGLGTMGMFLGMAAGMAATPALVDAVGLRCTMIVFFVVAAVSAGVFGVLAKERTPNVPSQTGGFVALLRQPKMLALFAIALLGLGSFNGLTTWLEQFLAPHGIDAATAGLVGGLLIVGGLFGAVAIPLWSDRVRRRKPFVVGCALVAAACTVPVCTLGDVHALYAFALAMGFFFLPTFALLLDMCASEAGLVHAGAATSLLMLFGNAGGVVVILAIPLFKARTGSDTLGIWMLAGLLVVAAAIAAPLRETRAVTND